MSVGQRNSEGSASEGGEGQHSASSGGTHWTWGLEEADEDADGEGGGGGGRVSVNSRGRRGTTQRKL